MDCILPIETALFLGLKQIFLIYSANTTRSPVADDIAIFANDGTALQLLLSAYSNLSKKMGLRINITKTETMSVDGHRLKRVERFKYLGSYVTRDCKLDEKKTARIQAASCAMGRLRDSAFNCRDLTADTKLKETIQSMHHPANAVWK